MVLCVFKSEQSTQKDVSELFLLHMPEPVLGACLHVTQFDTSHNLEPENFALNSPAR